MHLIAIGRISKPIGTRGEVKILPLTNDKQRFTNLRLVWVGNDESTAEKRTIHTVRIDAKQVVLNFSGIETVGEAELLRDRYLFVPKEKVVKLNIGNYFVDDVIGCEVVTEEQRKIGIVIDLFSLPANDVWIIWNGAKEIMIPAVKSIIRQVDVLKKRITVRALEGLLE
jgi:16S rRNA processing protein RimM